MEKFNPFNPEYRKVEDLPKEEQGNFKDIEGGFIQKTALEDIDEVRADEEYLIEMPEGAKVSSEQIEKYEQLIGHDETHRIRDEVKSLGKLLKEPLKAILNRIENDEFKLLICDDASGRIPTLIVRDFINEINKKKSYSDIITKFIAGTSMHDFSDMGETEKLKIEKISTYIEKIKELQSNISSALVVTEFIQSGEGLKPLISALSKNNISSTIITPVIDLRFRRNEQKKADLDEYLGGTVLYGISNTKPGIYSRSDISGVVKNIYDLFATPSWEKLTDKERSAFPYDTRENLLKQKKKKVFAKMIIARNETNKVANHLVEELLGKTE